MKAEHSDRTRDESLHDDLEVIGKYSNTVYRLAYSLTKNMYDADDIHQEVFIRYLCKHPEFANEEHERAWFLRVTVNLCKNLWKTAWKQRVVGLDDLDLENPPAVDESKWDIVDVVKQLPRKYRVVIHLFYYEELSIEEIAGILKMKKSTVRTQLVRARRKLGKMLKEDIDV